MNEQIEGHATKAGTPSLCGHPKIKTALLLNTIHTKTLARQRDSWTMFMDWVLGGKV